jgi:hypothetical protein
MKKYFVIAAMAAAQECPPFEYLNTSLLECVVIPDCPEGQIFDTEFFQTCVDSQKVCASNQYDSQGNCCFQDSTDCEP